MLRRRFVVRSLLAIFFGVGATATASAQFSQIYFFGDSLTDPGNLALAIGTDAGQVITGNTYIPSKPYASGQFTNGDVWAKTFANSMSWCGPRGLSVCPNPMKSQGMSRVPWWIN